MQTKKHTLSQAFCYYIEVGNIGRAACYLGEYKKHIAVQGNTIYFKSRKQLMLVLDMLVAKAIPINSILVS